MSMKAYTNGNYPVLARPMTNIEFHMQEEGGELDDYEGLEIEMGYFFMPHECQKTWSPKAVFEENFKELT